LLIFAFVLAVAGSIEDIRIRKIPNRLAYFGFIAAILIRLFVLGWPGLRDGLLGTLVGGGLFFFLFLIGGMGGGDVKLMAAASAFTGMTEIVNLLIATAVGGGAMAVVLMLYKQRTLATLRNTFVLIRHHLTAGLRPHPELNIDQAQTMRVPFAPAIAIGTLYCLSRTFAWG